MPKSLTETLDDPEFQKISPDAQKIVLGKMGVSDGMQGKLLEHLSKPAAPAPPGMPKFDAHMRMTTEPDPSGSFSQRIGDRLAQNLWHGPAALAQDVVDRTSGKPRSQEDKDLGEKTVFPWGREPLQAAAGIATAGPRAVYDRFVKPIVQDWTKDPANAVADIGTAALGAGEAEGGFPKTARAVDGAEDVSKRGAKSPKLEPPPSTGKLSPEQQAKFTEDIDKVNKQHAEALSQHAADEAAGRSKWVQKTAGAKKSVADAEAASNRVAALQRGSHEYTRLTHENLQSTYASARGALDQRWGQFRSAMEGAQLDPVEAVKNIDAAKAKYLKGSPSSLKVFNDLAQEIGIQQVTPEGEVITPPSGSAAPEPPELPFDTARIHYSAIGDKLSSGTLPGNVYQALKAVSEGLDRQLTESAETRKMGKEYSSLKADEHQFRSDWKDSRSPLAKAYAAQDPNYLKPHVTGKGADLLMQKLARYRKNGAKPYLPAAARRLADEADALPKPKLKPPPSKYEPSVPPKIKEVTKPEPLPAKEVKAGKVARTAAKISGKLVGGAAGTAVGHPFLGYAVGGEVGPAIADRLARRRAGLEPPPE